jgi:hypothetical protein
MANVFPKWTNWLPLEIVVFVVIAGATVTGAIWYYFTPKYTRVGYMPTQPVPYSHAIHVDQLGMDCRYCHSYVDNSSHANVPTTQTCMNCHSYIQKENPKLQPVRDSWETGKPIQWVKIHMAPDYVYFNHSVHVNRGISCVSCHGQVDQMEVVWHDKPHSMGFCLECHRSPEKNLRPVEQVYNLKWDATKDGAEVAAKLKAAHPDLVFKDIKHPTQEEIGKGLKAAWNIHAPESCAACHR